MYIFLLGFDRDVLELFGYFFSKLGEFFSQSSGHTAGIRVREFGIFHIGNPFSRYESFIIAGLGIYSHTGQ